MPAPAGATYEAIAAERIEQLKAMMDAVLTAEIDFMGPVVKACAAIFVGRQFLLLAYGSMSIERFMGSCIRVLVIAFLIGQSPHFVAQVKDPVFDRIPRAGAAVILNAAGAGTSVSASPAQQFDAVAMASDAVTARIQARNTGWNADAFGNYIAAAFQNGLFQSLLSCIVAIWLLGQGMLAIILCFGPYLLVFELFDRTRGWVDQWIGKIVGMIAFGFGTSMLLALQMTGLLRLLRSVHENLPNGGAEAVALLGRVVAAGVLDVFTMVALPVFTAFGSGVAASLAAPSAMLALRGGGALAGASIQAGGAVVGAAARGVAAANRAVFGGHPRNSATRSRSRS